MATPLPKSPKTASRPPQHVPMAAMREPEHEQEHDAPRVRTRRRSSSHNQDEFYIPVEEIPDGLSYEFKRVRVMGKEDPFYLAQMREQGWEPVPSSRHPTWVPPGYTEPNIIKGDQILMDRPMELTLEAQGEARQQARQQVIEAEQRLGKTPKGELTREHEGVKPKIVKELGRMIAIEE